MRYGIGAALLILALAAGCGKPAPKALEGVLFKDALAFLILLMVLFFKPTGILGMGTFRRV